MAQVNFTLKMEDIQAIIEKSGADELSKQLLTTILNQLMENQRDEYIQVDNYVRNQQRVSQRNGYYSREYVTRIGSLELNVPRTRDGQFSPSVFERYQRHEQALIASMLEMYVQGVSTRKVTKIVEELCGKSVSKSFISSLTTQLDQQVEDFLNKKFEIDYPFLFSDVLYLKVRENRRVVSKAFHLVVGINSNGYREVLGFRIGNTESFDSWKAIYEELIQRGLKGVKMVTSDAHKGEVEAIKQCFTGASWQRCQVHFMRNVFSHVPRKQTEEVRSELKALFRMTNIEAARDFKKRLENKYTDLYPGMIETLDSGFEDSFQYCSTIETNYSRVKSTNMLERVNEEIRRREKVIRIFPNEASALRLIGTILIDLNEEWITSDRQYISFSEETKSWLQ
ncbi:MAG: IS256 family transposase [Erysipelothrix sp.]|nr:IS256 family transposase [Erysipelothrix sp.]